MILWVDDDIESSLRCFLEEIQEAGYEVIRAKTPEEMWGVLEERRKDVCGIIMDIMLPTGEKIDSWTADMGVTTGLVLLNELKANPGYASIPLLIFTILRNQKVLDWATKNRVKLLTKQSTYPDELADEIKQIFPLGC